MSAAKPPASRPLRPSAGGRNGTIASAAASRPAADASTGLAAPPQPVDAATRAEIFRRFREANPHPEGELEHTDPYTLLIAVVLSAQATDRSVNLATRTLFRVADTPAKMVALGEERLTDYIRTIGLFRTKAKNVIALSKRLVAEHGGTVPAERAVLESLPGVGRKSAAVVLNIAFGQPTIAVDTHIFRVAHRIPLALGKTRDAVQDELERIVPEAYRHDAHHWLILHGRYVCMARRPDCPRCLIADLCRYPDKTPAALAPGGEGGAPTTASAAIGPGPRDGPPTTG